MTYTMALTALVAGCALCVVVIVHLIIELNNYRGK